MDGGSERQHAVEVCTIRQADVETAARSLCRPARPPLILRPIDSRSANREISVLTTNILDR